MKIDKNNLRRIRELKGYSLRELASMSGVNYTSLYRWETLDTACPRTSNVKKIAKILGVTLEELEKRDDAIEDIKDHYQSILAWIEYWINYVDNKPSCDYRGNEVIHDIYRAINDFDCKQTNGNLLADTIFSVWNPLKMVLECLNPGEKFYKEDKYGIDKNYYLKKIKKNINEYLPLNESLVKALLKFAELAMTRANVMILPSRAMQSRGNKYYDQMSPSLFQCFDDGEYTSCFKEIDVETWIKREHLECFFNEEDIKRDNIIPLICRMQPSEYEWLHKHEEIEEMICKYNEILLNRLKFY